MFFTPICQPNDVKVISNKIDIREVFSCVFISVLSDIQRVLRPFKFSHWYPFADTLKVICFKTKNRRHYLSWL